MTNIFDPFCWIGTLQRGLHRFDPQAKRFTRYSTEDGLIHPQVEEILVESNGTVWIGTSGGLCSFQPETETFETFTSVDQPETLFSQAIHPMVQTSDRTIWVGTDNGLFALQPGEHQLVGIKHNPDRADSLSNDDVNGLALDLEGRLWVATGLGVDRLLQWDGKRASFESINKQLLDPPSDPRIAGNLIPDRSGRMWDTCGVIDPVNWTYSSFMPSDGSDISGGWLGAYAPMKDGRLLFGGPTGLQIVSPNSLKIWNYEPPVVVTELRIDGKSQHIVPGAPLILGPEVRGFTVEYAALDYSAPKELLYAHQLTGYDDTWIETAFDQRIATYTNLDPGTYSLKVRGSNRRNKWSRQELSLEIRIEPAFYETDWFRALFALLVFGLLYLLYLGRVRQLKASEKRLESLVRQRTVELEKANAELDRTSKTDLLTNLPNRRAFLQVAQHELERFKRNGRKFCIILGDIDHFKGFNDDHGHDAGDQVLRSVSETFRNTIRNQDHVARWGGEEFIFILPETELPGATALAEKTRMAVADHALTFEDKHLSVTMTFGVAEFGPGLLEDCIKRADLALYKGKEEGRNRVISF